MKGADVDGDADEPEDGDDETQESDDEPQEPPEDAAEEGAGAGPEQESSEPETPESEPAEAKMVTIVMDQMEKFAKAKIEEEKTTPKISTLEVQDDPRITAQTSIGTKNDLVLLDGGASHNVYYSPTIPEGAVEKKIELARGSQTGYVKGGDITFLDETVSEERAKVPYIISLGRLVKKGFRLER